MSEEPPSPHPSIRRREERFVRDFIRPALVEARLLGITVPELINEIIMTAEGMDGLNDV